MKTVKAYALFVVIIGLIVAATAGDYYMFKRSHQGAGWLEYIWERG